jgi:UDP-N-acetyl-D-mannosaminuronic acid dehydrogenase
MMNTTLRPFSKIVVMGLGYIGLPTAAILASRKMMVIGVDINQNTVDIINRGDIHIVEPELDIVVRAVTTEGYLRATTKAESADAFLIAVPTPFKEHHQPDLSYIKAAAEHIAPHLQKGNLVILESTSPVGTTEQLAEWLAACRPDLTFPNSIDESSDIHIAYCPERVLPGHVLRELVQNDRIIGGLTPACSAKAIALYHLFVEGDCLQTTARTAEMCKLTENSFRDVNIAFANELSMICDTLAIDVWELIKLANHHPRVTVLQPGCGVGGHCIAVDPWFIVSSAPKEATLIRTAREVNDSKPRWVVDKIQLTIAEYLQEHSTKTARDVTVACFGLSFKADIDDLRESPALAIVQQLAAAHAGFITVIEPHIQSLPSIFSNRVALKDMDTAFKEADIVVMLVNHRAFMDSEHNIRPGTKVIDCRGVWPTLV